MKGEIRRSLFSCALTIFGTTVSRKVFSLRVRLIAPAADWDFIFFFPPNADNFTAKFIVIGERVLLWLKKTQPKPLVRTEKKTINPKHLKTRKHMEEL